MSRTPELRMFASVFRQEVRAARRSFVGWLIPGAVLLGATVSVQPSMSKEGSLFAEKLALMPKEMLVAFGISTLDFTNPAGYLAANFTLVTLLGALFAGLLGATVLSREEAYRTAEFLLVQPVSRRTVVLAKASAGLLLVGSWDAAVALVAFGTFAAVGVTLQQPGVIAAQFMAAALLHTSLFGLGLAATIRLARARTASSTALGLVFGSYGLGVVAALTETLDALKWLSPFRYAEAAEVVRQGGLPSSVAVLPVLLAAALVAAVLLFERKDIHA